MFTPKVLFLGFFALLPLVRGDCPCEFIQDSVYCERKTISNFPNDYLEQCPDLVDPESIKGFDLQDQLINALHSQSFAQFPNLVSIGLSFNEIEVIDKDAFDGLDHLSSLFLQYNQISELPIGVFDSLISLKHLDVRNNPVSNYTTR